MVLRDNTKSTVTIFGIEILIGVRKARFSFLRRKRYIFLNKKFLLKSFYSRQNKSHLKIIILTVRSSDRSSDRLT